MPGEDHQEPLTEVFYVLIIFVYWLVPASFHFAEVAPEVNKLSIPVLDHLLYEINGLDLEKHTLCTL